MVTLKTTVRRAVLLPGALALAAALASPVAAEPVAVTPEAATPGGEYREPHVDYDAHLDSAHRGPERPLFPTGKQVVPRNTPPKTRHQLPFPCGQVWVGRTRPDHSPNMNSVDFNRTDDFRDPVVASAAGVVVHVQPRDNGGYGKYVVIDHGRGESTLYSHLDAVTVRRDQHIDQGTQLGLLGTTGHSTGPHLHYEQRVGQTTVRAWINGRQLPMNTPVTSHNCADVPVAGQVAGSPHSEIGVFRRDAAATWELLPQPVGPAQVLRFGGPVGQPLLGDWDGNGTAEPGIRYPSGQFSLRTPGGAPQRFTFGEPADLPVAGDWDGDGRWEVGVRKVGTSWFELRQRNGQVTRVQVGYPQHIPVAADWNNDGRTDLGTFDRRTRTWRLWHQRADGSAVRTKIVYGAPGDYPIAGDWDANGHADLGVWRPGTATFHLRHADHILAPQSGVRKIVFGRTR